MTSQVETRGSGQYVPERSWLQHVGVLAAILVVYFFLAFYRIEHQSLWVDEIITVLADDPNRPLLARERWFGGRGPLYPLFLQLWPKSGSAEFAFRSLSAVVGGIVVCLAYVLGRRLYNDRAAWIGATLFATSPFLIWYSQEARYINLQIATAMLAMYAFHLAVSHKRAVWWLLYCGSVILATAAFLVNFLLPLANALWTLCTASGRSNWRKSLVCHLVVFVLFAWWANNGNIRQVDGYWIKLIATMTPSSVERVVSYPTESIAPLKVGGSRESNLFELPYTFFAFSTGFSLGPSVRDLQMSRSLATLLPHAFTLIVLGLLFGGFFIVGLMVLRRHPGIGKLPMFWLMLPIVGTIGITTILPGLSYNVRYAAMAFPPYVFILTAGIAGFQHPTLRTAFLGIVLAANAISLVNYYHNPQYAREDARAAARYLESGEGPGDVIVVVGHPRPIRYYYKGSLPVNVFRRRHNASTGEFLQTLREGYDRVWLVEIRPWQRDPRGHIKTTLEKLAQQEDQRVFPGVNVYLFVPHKSVFGSAAWPIKRP